MPDEQNSGNNEQEQTVEVSEQELADLGDFLAQVQIVLIGHESRIGVLEQAVFESKEAAVAGLPDEGDSGSADGRDEVAGQDESAGADESGASDAGESSDL